MNKIIIPTPFLYNKPKQRRYRYNYALSWVSAICSTAAMAQWVERRVGVRGIGSRSRQTKTLKLELDASLLFAQHYKDRTRTSWPGVRIM